MTFNLGYRPSEYRSTRPGFQGTSLQAVFEQFPDDEHCLKHVFSARYGLAPRCRKCDQSHTYYLRTEKKYFQNTCKEVLSPLAGTLFHATKLRLKLWFYAMLHIANSTDGLDGLFLHRHLGITYPAAFRMLQRIRLHCAAIDGAHRMGTAGEPVLVRIEQFSGIRRRSKGEHGSATVLLISDKDRVNSTVMRSPRHFDLRRVLRQKCVEGVVPITTCYHTYRTWTAYGTRLRGLEYQPNFHELNLNYPNHIHAFISYSFYPLKLRHRLVSKELLWMYFKEFEFRFNRRNRSHDIFWDLVGQFPKLTPDIVVDLAYCNSQ